MFILILKKKGFINMIKNINVLNFLSNNRKLAFSLAEVLVVVGIIGVVASLTLPNLNNSTNDKETVVALKKTYADLSNAFGQAELKYGPIATWRGGNGNIDQRFMERMMEFLQVTKYCGSSSPDNCHKYLGGGHNNNMPTMILKNGASILFSGGNCTKLEQTDIYSYCGTLQVDVDGPKKGKNELKYDQFDFYVTKEKGLVPRGYQYPHFSRTWCFSLSNVCGAWVIDYGNQDYLKANSSGKCNNSSVTLSEKVTSCK